MRSKVLAIPLSVAAASTLAFGAFDFTITADEWKIIGSDRGVDVANMIGSAGSCANTALVSAWRYDTSGDVAQWTTVNCTFDVTSVGYSTVASVGGYEGLWVHASSTGGTVTAQETLSESATSMSLVSGWNLLSTGSVGVTLASNTTYDIFNDQSNGVSIYAYDNGTWEVYSPNAFTGANVLTALDAYEGFWANVTGAATYNASVNGESSQIDFDGSVLVDPETGGAGLTINENVTEGILEVLEPKSTRFVLNDFSGVDSNVSTTADTLAGAARRMVQEINGTSTTYGPATGSGGTATTNDTLTLFESPTSPLAIFFDRGVSPTVSSTSADDWDGVFYSFVDEVLDLAQAEALENPANTLAAALDDFNLSVYDPNLGFTEDELGAIYPNLNEYLIQEQAYEDAGINYESNVTASSDLASILAAAQDDVDRLVSASSSLQTQASSITTLVNSVVTELDSLIAAAQNKVVTPTYPTPASAKVDEINKTISIQPTAAILNDDATAGLRIKILQNGTNIDNSGDNYIELSPFTSALTDGSLEQNVSNELNATFGVGFVTTFDPVRGPLIDSTSETGADSSYANFLVTGVGYNAAGDITEINITGKGGSVDFSISAEENATDSGGVFKPVPTLVRTTPKPAASAVAQVVQLDFTGVTLGTQDVLDINFTFPSDENRTGAFENNITYTVQESDIGGSDAATIQTVLSAIESLLESESNLSTSSVNIVNNNTAIQFGFDSTVSTEPDVAYTAEVSINGVDFTTAKNEGDIAVLAAAAVENNLTAFNTDDTLDSVAAFRNAFLAADGAVNLALTGTGGTSGTVYGDTTTGIYWNLEGTGQTTAANAISSCSLATTNNLQGWRLPTVLEVVSIHDPASFAVDATLQNAENSAFTPNSYVLTSNQDESGNYYIVRLDGTGGITWDGTTSQGNLLTTCVADYFDNSDSTLRFNDYYYYTNSGASTNRLATSGGLVADGALLVNWQLKSGLDAPGADEFTTWADASSYCSGRGQTLPTAAQLRSLNFYDLKARYDQTLDYDDFGLNRSTLFSTDFNDTTPYWTSTQDTDANETSYFIINPVSDIDLTNIYDTSAPATGGTTVYKAVCLSAQ